MIDQARSRFEALKAGGLLPSPQGVALAVLELTQRSDANLHTLTHLVQTDPAMAGRILRYANAVHGGSLRHIASLPHAIVFLGLFRVRQIALSFSLIDHYRAGACAAFDYLGYWTASLATGIAAQRVAAQAQCPPEESFTCGLLSGVGRLALATVFPVEYDALLRRNLSDGELRAAETNELGIDHAELSAALLRDWGLPEIFHEAVRYHEAPADAPFDAGSRAQALTAALHFAARVGDLLNLDDTRRWERVPSLYHAAARIGLEDHEVPPLVQQVVEQWHDWGRELRLPTREISDIKALLSDSPPVAQDGAPTALVIVPMRVALVIREPSLMRRLATTLGARGLVCLRATDHAAGLRLLADNQIDLMMVELPDSGESSARMLRELRAADGARQAYCLALIPRAAEAEVARLMLAGAADYLLLDYTDASLLARLNTAQRVLALQGAVRAERESAIRSSGEWARDNRRLLRQALTDPLTRLYNRRYGLDRLAQEWSFATHSATPLAVLMLDIDHFKQVNDLRGHDIGDRVLTQMARVVQRVCRKDDVVFRFGGEEFCVVAPNTGLQDALLLGERIVEAARRATFGEEGLRFHVTLSVGVAARDAGDADVDAMLARADRALYAAKHAGRDRVMVARGGDKAT